MTRGGTKAPVFRNGDGVTEMMQLHGETREAFGAGTGTIVPARTPRRLLKR
jgi:hypothetical protein